ncbi:MAG: VanW family protein [Clostridia bacterium]|nr:VanW family protein [Clostridia bacterium]
MARMDRYKKKSDMTAPPLRAAFPEERQQFFQQQPENYVPYPDQVYEVQEDEDYYPNAFGQPQYQPAWNPAPVQRRKNRTALWAMVGFICMMILALIGYGVYRMYEPSIEFEKKLNVVMQDTFAQGVIVDHVHIGGMTREQAKAALLQSAGYNQQELNITVNVEGYQWVLTGSQLPVQRNIDAVLDTAYAFGRKGTTETIGSGVTPMEYRYQHLYHTVSNAAYLYTEVTYDPATVRELVGIIADTVNCDPVDAQIATFDFSTRSFTFTEERTGMEVDTDLLYNTLIDCLNRNDYRANISMEAKKTLPSVTRVELMNSFSLISSYTTQTTADANRNNNVDLAAKAVMGTVVMPGETFSFNTATGQRTTQKGYLPAAAIAGGTTVDEVGGGVCQVSSTLFNAAVMADMTVVTRYPHTWPSNYVDKGRDATVNWPNLDFVFRNDRTSPIFIVAYYQNRKCTVEIYGASLGAGESRDLISQVVDVTEPPAEPLMELNTALPFGTTQEKKKPRTGYVVDTYKIYKRNGTEYKREKLCTSVYRVIQQVIEYNY